MTTPPLISIVTPCRDAARFLPRALGSVARCAAEAGVNPAAPGGGAIEHIIMDGGSGDGSADLIRAHADKNPGLVTHWESRPDAGQSDAINRGLSLARGRYGAWLNADDWYEPGALVPMLARLSRDDAPDVLIGRCRFVDEAGHTIWDPRPPEPLNLANLLRLRSQWFNGRSLVQPEVFFSLEWFRRLGGLNVNNHYTMDHELWCRLLEAGARFETIDVKVACLGVHAGQKTRDNREVARSVLHHSLRMAQRSEALGAERAGVLIELNAMADKLRLADGVIRWWQRGLDPRTVRHALRPEEQPLPGEGAEQALRSAARAARRGLRWKRRPRIALFDCDPHIAPAVLGVLRRSPAELHIAAHSRLILSQTGAALRDSVPSQVIRGHEGPLLAGDLDLIVVQSVSLRSLSPAAGLGDLWSRLAPGGVLLQLDDPLRSPKLARYIEFLSKRLADLITANNDMLLHPQADEFLRRVAAVAGPEPIGGIDPEEIVPHLSSGARRLGRFPYGTCEDHPLTAFVALGEPKINVFPSWISSAWRKM